MTPLSPTRRGTSAMTVPTRRFAIGQSVRLRSGYGNPSHALNEIYRVTGLMPATEVSFQYRLRQDSDPFERVATEDSLDLVRIEEPGKGKSPTEAVFQT